MANWLDVLAEDHSDSRGRLNLMSLIRGFTKRGREETDRAIAGRELPKQEVLDRIQRQQAARGMMAGGINPMTFQPRTPEEVEMLNQALGPVVTHGNLGAQDVLRRRNEQELAENTEQQPFRTQGAKLGNEAVAQTMQFNEQLQPGRVAGQSAQNRLLTTQAQGAEEMLPFQVGAAKTQNLMSEEQLQLLRGIRPYQERTAAAGAEGAEFSNQRDRALLPGQLESQNLGNASAQFNLARGGALLPGEVESQRLNNRSQLEQLVESMAGQEYRVGMLRDQAEGTARTNREMEETAPYRKKAIENASKVDPRVQSYLQQYPFLQYDQNRPQADTQIRQLLGLPVDINPPVNPQAENNAALQSAIQAAAQRRRYDSPTPPQVEQPQAASAPRQPNQLILPKVAEAGKKAGNYMLQTFGNAPPDQEMEGVRRLLQTPEGRQRLEQLYPSLSPGDKQRIQMAIKQLQGQ